MKNTRLTNNYLFTLLFLVTALPALADDTGFDDNVDDEVLSINYYVLPLLAAGIATAYTVLKRKRQTV